MTGKAGVLGFHLPLHLLHQRGWSADWRGKPDEATMMPESSMDNERWRGRHLNNTSVLSQDSVQHQPWWRLLLRTPREPGNGIKHSLSMDQLSPQNSTAHGCRRTFPCHGWVSKEFRLCPSSQFVKMKFSLELKDEAQMPYCVCVFMCVFKHVCVLVYCRYTCMWVYVEAEDNPKYHSSDTI